MGYLILAIIIVGGIIVAVKSLGELFRTPAQVDRNEEPETGSARSRLPHDSEEILEMKRQAQSMAEKQGVVITGWGDVKYDEDGRAYIECYTHVPDGKEGEYVDSMKKEFGDKISEMTIVSDTPKQSEE